MGEQGVGGLSLRPFQDPPKLSKPARKTCNPAGFATGRAGAGFRLAPDRRRRHAHRRPGDGRGARWWRRAEVRRGDCRRSDRGGARSRGRGLSDVRLPDVGLPRCVGGDDGNGKVGGAWLRDMRRCRACAGGWRPRVSRGDRRWANARCSRDWSGHLRAVR